MLSARPPAARRITNILPSRFGYCEDVSCPMAIADRDFCRDGLFANRARLPTAGRKGAAGRQLGKVRRVGESVYGYKTLIDSLLRTPRPPCDMIRSLDTTGSTTPSAAPPLPTYHCNRQPSPPRPAPVMKSGLPATRYVRDAEKSDEAAPRSDRSTRT